MILTLTQPWANGIVMTGTPTYVDGVYGQAIRLGAATIEFPVSGYLSTAEGEFSLDITPRPSAGVNETVMFADEPGLPSTFKAFIFLIRGGVAAWVMGIETGTPSTWPQEQEALADNVPVRLTWTWKHGGNYVFYVNASPVKTGTFSTPVAPIESIVLQGGPCDIEAMRWSSRARSQAELAAELSGPLLMDSTADAMFSVANSAPLYRDAKTVTLPAPLRPVQSRLLPFQAHGRDSAGDLHLHRRGATKRKEYRFRVKMSSATYAELTAWFRDKLKGAGRPFVWIDESAVHHNCIMQTKRLAGSPMPGGRYMVDLQFVEMIAD